MLSICAIRHIIKWAPMRSQPSFRRGRTIRFITVAILRLFLTPSPSFTPQETSNLSIMFIIMFMFIIIFPLFFFSLFWRLSRFMEKLQAQKTFFWIIWECHRQCVFPLNKNALLPNCHTTIKVMKLMLAPYYLLIFNIHSIFINCSSNSLNSERNQLRILHCP